jgi:hypothetical protein
VPIEELRPLFILLRPKGERVAVVRGCCRVGVYGKRPVAGRAERQPRRRLELRNLPTGGPRQLERRSPMKGEQLSMVVGAAEAAEAELSLSRMRWQRGQNDMARVHETRAEELAGTEPSLAAVRVLAFVARTRTIGGDPAEGLRLATEALAMAEALELDDLRAHSLATIGLAKVYLGDPTGAQDEVRALEIAMTASSPVAGSIANNVAVHAFFSFEFRRAGELFEEGLRIAERLGDASGARWLRAQVGSFAVLLGRWDDSLQLLDEFNSSSRTSRSNTSRRCARSWTTLPTPGGNCSTSPASTATSSAPPTCGPRPAAQRGRQGCACEQPRS